MPIPYTFASQAGPIPLTQLDSNFAAPITLGSTTLTLGNTTLTVAGLSLTSPTVTSGPLLPGVTNTQTIGAVGDVWSNVYATTFTGTTFTGNAAGLSATLAIGSGGTNSTATPTAGGAGYGTGTAHAYTVAGTAGQVLTSQGASAPTWTTISLATPTPNVQTFTSTGTWTAPTGAYTALRIQMWSGGGGGIIGGNGANGGSYKESIIPFAYLTTGATITVGSGGSGGASPTAGGTSSVTLNTVYNGSSTFSVLGGAAGVFTDGGSPVSFDGGLGVPVQFSFGGKGGYTDAGGGTVTARTSEWGGGGGGNSISGAQGAAGASLFGGAGGAGSGAGAGVAGTAPGGAGGSGTTTAGSGAAGKVIITAY